MSKAKRIRSCLFATPRFELGDRVIVHQRSEEGVVVGVRYGEIAFDVRCGGVCIRNLAPELIRFAPPRLSFGRLAV